MDKPKYCPYCGHEIQPDWKICPYCGHQLEVKKTTIQSKIIYYYIISLILGAIFVILAILLAIWSFKASSNTVIQYFSSHPDMGERMLYKYSKVALNLWNLSVVGGLVFALIGLITAVVAAFKKKHILTSAGFYITALALFGISLSSTFWMMMMTYNSLYNESKNITSNYQTLTNTLIGYQNFLWILFIVGGILIFVTFLTHSKETGQTSEEKASQEG